MNEINLDDILRRIAEDVKAIKNANFIKFDGRIINPNQASGIIRSRSEELLIEDGFDLEA